RIGDVQLFPLLPDCGRRPADLRSQVLVGQCHKQGKLLRGPACLCPAAWDVERARSLRGATLRRTLFRACRSPFPPVLNSAFSAFRRRSEPSLNFSTPSAFRQLCMAVTLVSQPSLAPLPDCPVAPAVHVRLDGASLRVEFDRQLVLAVLPAE